MAFQDQISRRRFLLTLTGAVGAGLLAACAAPSAPATQAPAKPTEAPKPGATAAPAAAGGKLEIFSWWTSPGEVEALDALYAVYKRQNPNVEIVNAALAGGTGAGGNMKAVLQTRMLAGQPPDSFQVHLGKELIDNHVRADRMEPIDDLYASEGWDKVIPQGLRDLASFNGKQWSVPVNIHRSNVIWYNTKIFKELDLKPPTTFDEFFAVAEKLKAKNIYALSIGESAPGPAAHHFENVLAGVLGPDAYTGLWNGKTAWTDKKVTEALETFKKLLEYANPNYLSVDWAGGSDLVIAGTAAMNLDGDWKNGYYKAKKFADFSWVPSPGTKGVYVALSDSFGLPKNAPNRANAIAWLKVCGSLEGQEAFNPIKGSIPARTDAGKSKEYDDYQRAAMEDFKRDKIVPSVVHGFAAKESWVTDFVNAVNSFVTKKDVAAAQQALVKAAKDAGVG